MLHRASQGSRSRGARPARAQTRNFRGDSFLAPRARVAPRMRLLTAMLLPITSALLQPTPRSRIQPTRARAQDGWTTAATQEREAAYACCSVLRVPLDRVQRRSIQLFAQLTDWTTCVDEASGATYYYNGETGESQWEPPPQAAIAQQDDGGQSASEHPHGTNQALWRFVGSSGTVVNGYRHVPYNLRKHDVQVLSRFNMLNQRLTVSRKQCLVPCYVENQMAHTSASWISGGFSQRQVTPQAAPRSGQPRPISRLGRAGTAAIQALLSTQVSCLADGSATLTSVGRGATLWREKGGPWCSVQRGEGLVLSDGDQVSGCNPCARGCNPTCSRLQSYVLEAATPCIRAVTCTCTCAYVTAGELGLQRP